jgi:hypothetical protein
MGVPPVRVQVPVGLNLGVGKIPLGTPLGNPWRVAYQVLFRRQGGSRPGLGFRLLQGMLSLELETIQRCDPLTRPRRLVKKVILPRPEGILDLGLRAGTASAKEGFGFRAERERHEMSGRATFVAAITPVPRAAWRGGSQIVSCRGVPVAWIARFDLVTVVAVHNQTLAEKTVLITQERRRGDRIYTPRETVIMVPVKENGKRRLEPPGDPSDTRNRFVYHPHLTQLRSRHQKGGGSTHYVYVRDGPKRTKRSRDRPRSHPRVTLC